MREKEGVKEREGTERSSGKINAEEVECEWRRNDIEGRGVEEKERVEKKIGEKHRRNMDGSEVLEDTVRREERNRNQKVQE